MARAQVTALLRLDEAATYLGIGETKLRELVHRGLLPWIDLSGGDKRKAMRFHLDDLDAFIASARRQSSWPSTSPKTATPTPTSSNSGALDFEALRAKRLNEKLRNSSDGQKTRQSAMPSLPSAPARPSKGRRL
ncbi:MAG: hypothetical protein DI537_23950 [Stutzerimonas stutzeri]|nr:MAG: hypothetical protein DI537_23950 [Stutzerimonas stutzeri]